MDATLLYTGLVVGFSIAAPVGPIGVLCIRRTLADGRAAGLLSGLGAATADAFYGSVAGFGLTFISSLLVRQQTWFSLVGGLFLCYLGLRTYLAAPSPPAPLPEGEEGRASNRVRNAPVPALARAYLSTLLLTLTNPATILSFAAVFAGLGLGQAGGDYGSAGLLVAGVFAGSALWWLLLSGGVSAFRARLGDTALCWVNRASGVIIALFGLLALANLFRQVIYYAG